jgi:hypothetical protein
MFGYTGPVEFSDVIVIVLIGVPVGLLAGDEVDAALLAELLALLVVLLLELLPHADSASAATSPAATRTSDHCRRRGSAPLLSRPCICSPPDGGMTRLRTSAPRYELRQG